MSDEVADPAGGEDGGLTPELDPAISPGGGYIPPSSSADVAAPGLLTASQPVGSAAAEVPATARIPSPEASFALPHALESAPSEMGSPPLPGEVAPLPLPGASARPARRGRASRVFALVVLIVLGVAGVGAGGALLARELTRGPTKAEKNAAVLQDITSRWQRYPAGKIFTPTLDYSSADWGATFKATLVGIAPAASCAAALDPAMAGYLAKYGCVTVLRATYLDYSGTQAVTVAVVVMRTVNGAATAASQSASAPASAGVRTFPLPGTVAAEFGDAQRRYFSTVNDLYNYVFLSVTGYTDGRISGSASSMPSLEDLGSGVISSVGSALTYPGSACAMKDIRC
jgi:hypothetical protein